MMLHWDLMTGMLRTLPFVVVGFAAQLVDGAFGMGFGVISSTVLYGFGIPPAVVSGSVNGAKILTGAASGIGHLASRNETFVAATVLTVLVKHLGIASLSEPIIGLLAGAMIATSIAIGLTRKLPVRALTGAVGTVVVATAALRFGHDAGIWP